MTSTDDADPVFFSCCILPSFLWALAASVCAIAYATHRYAPRVFEVPSIRMIRALQFSIVVTPIGALARVAIVAAAVVDLESGARPSLVSLWITGFVVHGVADVIFMTFFNMKFFDVERWAAFRWSALFVVSMGALSVVSRAGIIGAYLTLPVGIMALVSPVLVWRIILDERARLD